MLSMTVYLTAAVPIFMVLVIGLHFTDEIKNRSHLLFILYGFLFSLPAIVLHKTIGAEAIGTFSYGELFLYSLSSHYLIYYAIGLICFHISFGFREGRQRGFESSSIEFRAFAFFGGFYLIKGVLEAVLSYKDYNSIILFFHPTVWLILLVTSPVALSFAHEETGVKKILGYAGSLTVPVIGSLIFPLLYRLEYLPGILATALFAGGAYFLFHWYIHKNYSGSKKRVRITLKPRV